MGYDAFGLPAEQFAVQTGQHPRITTEANIAAIRAQLRRLGVDHDDAPDLRHDRPGLLQVDAVDLPADLRRPGSTADAGRPRPRSRSWSPSWTPARGRRRPAPTCSGRPWAELDEVERRTVVDAHRLAYLNQAPVNWCPGLGTVLSNEEVTADGRSERGNFPVFRRPLTQWMMRITAYADRLLADLDRLDWPDSLKLMQRNWIGRSTGARIGFSVRPGDDRGLHHPAGHAVRRHLHGAGAGAPAGRALTAAAWPTAPTPAGPGERPPPRGGHRLPAAGLAALGAGPPDRGPRQDRRLAGRDRGQPVNGRELPVFIADYVLTGYGTGAIMAVPGEDTRDWEFAEAFGLPVDPHRAAAGGLGRRRVDRRRPDDQLGQRRGLAGRAGQGHRDRHHHRLAGRARPRRGDHDLQAARLAVQPAALLGRAVPDRLRRERPADRRAAVDAAGAAAGGRRLLAEDLRRRRRRLRSGAAAVARHRVDDGRAGPGRRAAQVPPRDQHDAQLGRVVLVLPALPGPG